MCIRDRRRQGLGKPNLLYVKDLYAGLSQSNHWKYENHTSGSLKNELPVSYTHLDVYKRQVVGSSIAREADKVFYTLAGSEISVGTTKAYSAQLAAIYSLAVQFAKVRGKITEEQYSYYLSELLTLPEKMQKALEDMERIQWFAAKYANAHDVFCVDRGIDYAVCLEGSLKLK